MKLRPVVWLALSLLVAAARLSAAPVVFWASDPVRPNETVVALGDGFGPAPTVELSRLPDAPSGAAPSGAASWTRAELLDHSDQCLKFVVPAAWQPGLYTFRVTAAGAVSTPWLLNAPTVWWLQGDAGQTATPGGWLRAFGRCLGDGTSARARLVNATGGVTELKALRGDTWALQFELKANLAPGDYGVRLHNGQGGEAGWRSAGTLRIAAPDPWPTQTFNVLAQQGPDAEAGALAEMRRSLIKYNQPADRTAGIRAALAKAKANGGGVVYFPAGRYQVKGELSIPPRTMLRGEGMGLVTLWWGNGRLNLDGGNQLGLPADDKDAPPKTVLSGPSFGLEDMSLYVPPVHNIAVWSSEAFRMHRVRLRVDHLWAIDGSKRPEGTLVRMEHNFEVTDCDLIAEGVGLVPGEWGLIAHNRVLAGKTNCPLGGARGVIVEDNTFVSTYPTAYQNISGVGQNLYYARNRHEAQDTHQADYSFTFDAGAAAYCGTLARVDGSKLTLAADPTWPNWAGEQHGVWKRAAVCVLDGRGAGQWRLVTAHAGREWQLESPFDVPPDLASRISIVTFNGRALVVDNQFEDANWVNAGYGTAIDVIYAGNHLRRCAQLLNYGLVDDSGFLPNFCVQYLANTLSEGAGSIDTGGSVRGRTAYAGPITRATIHRRAVLDTDDCGDIGLGGQAADVLVEGCELRHPASRIRVQRGPTGVVLRHNLGPKPEGEGVATAVVVP